MIDESLIRIGLVCSIPRIKYDVAHNGEFSSRDVPSDVLNPLVGIDMIVGDSAICVFYDKNLFGFEARIPISYIKEHGTHVVLEENDKKNIEELCYDVWTKERMEIGKFTSGFSFPTKCRLDKKNIQYRLHK